MNRRHITLSMKLHIKTEYLKTGASIRYLANKYNASEYMVDKLVEEVLREFKVNAEKK